MFDGMLDVQPQSAISAISGMYLFVPIIMVTLQIICLTFYKLDKEYPQIMAELKIREAKAKAETGGEK